MSTIGPQGLHQGKPMDDLSPPRPLALVTGASSGIGLELARLCAGEGYDLLIAADEPSIDEVGVALHARGGHVTALCVDLATHDGVTRLHEAAGGRPIDLLLANAGHGLGDAFLDQDFAAVRHVIDTNITGTLDLIQRVARQMRLRGEGRILITGSVAGVMPGAFQAVYHGSKAFIDSFAYALRNELKDSGVTVTVLMPGPTDTHFFERAGMQDTKVNSRRKDDPADVARAGFEAMMDGQPRVISGLKHKLQVAAAGLTPPSVLAEQNRRLNQPGRA
jgi:short-subunit dehydrogenase